MDNEHFINTYVFVSIFGGGWWLKKLPRTKPLHQMVPNRRKQSEIVPNDYNQSQMVLNGSKRVPKLNQQAQNWSSKARWKGAYRPSHMVRKAHQF